MKVKVGIMGSADDALEDATAAKLGEQAEQLGRALAARGCVALTGATTGLPHIVGATAHAAGALHVGVSPAENEKEHVGVYGLPLEGCGLHIYTGFGLKGRNVVLVRSSDIVIIIRGSMGALNEFTIAHDEGKIIGLLTGTGGVADAVEDLMKTLPKQTRSCVLRAHAPDKLLDACLEAFAASASQTS